MSLKEELAAALNFGALGSKGRQSASTSLVSVVLFFQADPPHNNAPRGLATADLRLVCPGQAGLLGSVIRTGEPAVTDDPAHDPELAQFTGFQSCASLMALPLRAGLEIYGVAVYGHWRPHFFDDSQRALLAARVNQAILGLHNAQLSRALREAKAQLIDVRDQTRKELARDLHDGPAQDVLVLATRASHARRLLRSDVQAAGEQLSKIEELARKANKEIRHMLFTLRPLILESQGLGAALQALAEKLKETYGQNVIVEAAPGVVGSPGTELEFAL